MYYRSKSQWGTHIWNYIHSITIIDYDYYNNIKTSNEAYELLKQIKLPCSICQKELDLQLVHNIDKTQFGNSMYLFKWSWAFHNHINKKLHKPIISYEKALNIHANVI